MGTMEVGRALGLSARVLYESDAKFVDMFSYIQKIIQHTPLSIFPIGIFPSSARMSSLALEYFPAKSETKEFNIVLRLSTKGMMHSLSKKMISEHEISSEFSQVKSVLSQLEKANVVEITGMTKSSSGSELKKIQTVVVLGKKSVGVTPSHMVAIDVSPISAGGYGLRYEGKIELPKLMNRWNIEKMVEETLKGGFQVSFSLESLARWRASRLLPSLKRPRS